jgi:lipopolysaccharide transport system permease protein
VINTSNTFVGNASIFGKIYFPRLVTPISVVISNLIRFGVQLGLFILVASYYFFISPEPGHEISMNSNIVFLPFLLLIVALLGMGTGIIVSSLTIKYRDLSMFIGFALQFLMYLSPVVYPVSRWGKLAWVMKYNPLTCIIESFRNGFLGTGKLDIYYLIYSFIFSTIVFIVGVMLFNRVEKSFMDTI